LEHVGGIGVWGDGAGRDILLVRAIFHGFEDLIGQVVELLGSRGMELLGGRGRGRGD
jgi:hypothetical protein